MSNILLHACCAPCSSYVLEYLNPSFDIDLFYYNPNIAPPEEFEKRVAEQARLVSELPHDGKIEVLSREGVGTRFTVRFPKGAKTQINVE